jgi:hypothetical protein
MRFVEETDGKSFVQVNDGTKKEEKEYASKGVAGTALGLGIAGTALWLLNGGLNGCGLFGRNCGAATAAEIAVNSNEQYLERKECEDMVALTKLVQDENGMIDVEGIMSETIDNLLVAQVKKYPEVLGGVEIGNGKVRMNIPVINKVIEFDTDDVKTLKETLISK